MKNKFTAILAILLFLNTANFAQGIAINADGNAPDNSAILDIQSTTKGMLVPRMKTGERTAIANPTTGLLVFDTTAGSFYFYNGAAWQSLSNNAAPASHEISDGDNDTRVSVEEGNDEDEIHFFVEGKEQWTMEKSRLEPKNAGGSIFIGSNAGSMDDLSNNQNVFIGTSAGAANTTGEVNSFVGSLAGLSNTTGSGNSFFGGAAGLLNTTGNDNCFFGNTAGAANTLGFENCFFGAHSGDANTTGSSNSFFGAYSGDSNGSGGNNSFFGYQSGRDNTDGSSNSFFGNLAGSSNTIGGANAFFGSSTGLSNTTGDDNSFFGNFAGHNNSTGNDNSFFGRNAGVNVTTGYDNSYFGKNTGNMSTTGWQNSFFGSNAGVNISSGAGNLCLGYFSGSQANVNSPVNSTAVGILSRITANNQVRIGDSNTNSIGGYAAWTNLSDGRFKTQIEENVAGLAFIQQLRPVTYNLDMPKLQSFLYDEETIQELNENNTNPQKGETRFTGFIAQEVEAAAREVGFDFSGVDQPQNEFDHYGLRYAEFVVPLVKAVQEQQEMIENLKAEVAALKAVINE